MVAFKIGRAFTKGRKSAPAEFREVENQLYSSSTALEAVAKLAEADQNYAQHLCSHVSASSTEGQQPPAGSVLEHVLESCKETLGHLEDIVKKYSGMVEPTDADAASSKPRYKRWKQGFLQNWSKISWTTEGGDLAKLNSNLMVHTNSMNLLLSAITRCVLPLSHSFTLLMPWEQHPKYQVVHLHCEDECDALRHSRVLL